MIGLTINGGEVNDWQLVVAGVVVSLFKSFSVSYIVDKAVRLSLNLSGKKKKKTSFSINRTHCRRGRWMDFLGYAFRRSWSWWCIFQGESVCNGTKAVSSISDEREGQKKVNWPRNHVPFRWHRERPWKVRWYQPKTLPIPSVDHSEISRRRIDSFHLGERGRRYGIEVSRGSNQCKRGTSLGHWRRLVLLMNSIEPTVDTDYQPWEYGSDWHLTSNFHRSSEQSRSHSILEGDEESKRIDRWIDLPDLADLWTVIGRLMFFCGAWM